MADNLPYYARLAWHACRSLLPGEPDLALPSHSAALSEAEYARTLEACAWIGRAIAGRDAYIVSACLDPAIANPAANWALDNSFYDGFRAIVSGSRANINALRVFSQPFTGLYLGLLNNRGATSVRELPPDLDAEAAALLRDRFAPWRLKYQAMVGCVPELKGLGLPLAFGETGLPLGVGGRAGGHVVNWDTLVYLERLALLLRSGIIEWLQAKPRPVILEIGSGFGALAYLIKKLVPGCSYICLDLPESLLFAAIYLLKFHPGAVMAEPDTSMRGLAERGVSFVPNYLCHRLVSSGLRVDLAVNTLSMSEMSVPQVADYCSGLQNLLGQDGVFFEQNHDLLGVGLADAQQEIARHFPHRAHLQAGIRLTQGAANAWAANAAALRRIGPERRAAHSTRDGA